jgi:hypothetical protein
MLLVTGKGPTWKNVVAAAGTGAPAAAEAKGKIQYIVRLQIEPNSPQLPSPSIPKLALVANKRRPLVYLIPKVPLIGCS